jgi:fumarate reductase flavoprotein subunit
MPDLSPARRQDAPYDVLVVGGGLAGLMAAVRAREAGASVLLVDRHSDMPAWNNSRIASGAFHVAFEPPDAPSDHLYERIMEITGETARPDQARALADSALPTLVWLEQRWHAFGRWDGAGFWLAEPHGLGRKGLPWEGYGMDRLMRALQESFRGAGGELLPHTTAGQLLHGNGRVAGAVLRTAAGPRQPVAAKTVILADGGFQANLSMLQDYIAPAPERLKLRAAGNGKGDGIRMAQEAGARCVGMENFYGHCLHRDSLARKDLWPYPVVDGVMAAGIVVDQQGHRLVDEGSGGVRVTNLLARRENPLDAYAVFDQAIWEGPAREGLFPASPTLAEAGATVWRSRDLRRLAAAAGIDPAGLVATIDAYNVAVQAGRTSQLSPPRTPSPTAPFPISQPPFFAIPIVPGITHTMGGVLISGRAEVLDEEAKPIRGLFAAGATAGGLDGGPQVGYVGGLAEAAVFGWIAGKEAAAPAAGSP